MVSEALPRREGDVRKARWSSPGQRLHTSGCGGLECLFCVFFALIFVIAACMCVADGMGITTRSAIAVPTSELRAGQDSSAPDVETGALKAAEDDPETASEKHPAKLVTAIS